MIRQPWSLDGHKSWLIPVIPRVICPCIFRTVGMLCASHWCRTSEQASYTEAAVINLLTYVAVTKGLITHWYKVLGYGCCACTSLCENGDEKFYMIFRPNQFYCGLFVSGNQDPLQRTHAETETLFLAYRYERARSTRNINNLAKPRTEIPRHQDMRRRSYPPIFALPLPLPLSQFADLAQVATYHEYNRTTPRA